MLLKTISLILLASQGHGFIMPTIQNRVHNGDLNPYSLVLQESTSSESFEFPDEQEAVITEYKKQPLADPERVNEKLQVICKEVLQDPEVLAVLKDLGIGFNSIYDSFGFSGVSLTASCSPKIGPVSDFALNGRYARRPTLLLFDRLNSFAIKFTINDKLFESIQNFLKLHQDEIEEGIVEAAAEGHPLAELIGRIFINFINANKFEDMIDGIKDDVRRLKAPINKWIDDRTGELVDNNGILTTLIVFLRNLSAGFDIRASKSGLFQDQDEIFLSVRGNIIIATGGVWISWKPDSIEGEIKISTRSGIDGLLLNLIDPDGADDFIDTKGLKEAILLIPRWLETMNSEHQKEITEGAIELFKDWGNQIKDELVP